MKYLILMALLSISLSHAQSQRGGHDGGGGRSIVCYLQSGAIESVELLDFFEGRMLESLHIPDQVGSYKEIYLETIKKSSSKSLREGMKKGLDFISGFKFLPKGVRLNAINDSSEIFVPGNCKVEQLVNFQGPGRIFIVKDFWDMMSETAKAGLLMHEFIWFLDREAGFKTSARSRRTVGQYFADNYQFEANNLNVKVGDIYCSSYNSGHLSSRFNAGNAFFASAIPGTHSCLLNFDVLNGMPAFTRQTAFVEECDEWDFNRSDWYREAGDVIREMMDMFKVMANNGESWTHSLNLSLRQYKEPNDTFLHREFKIQTVNREFPGYEEKEEVLECSPIDQEDIDFGGWGK